MLETKILRYFDKIDNNEVKAKSLTVRDIHTETFITFSMDTTVLDEHIFKSNIPVGQSLMKHCGKIVDPIDGLYQALKDNRNDNRIQAGAILRMYKTDRFFKVYYPNENTESHLLELEARVIRTSPFDREIHVDVTIEKPCSLKVESKFGYVKLVGNPSIQFGYEFLYRTMPFTIIDEKEF